jgi:hypothetical protein
MKDDVMVPQVPLTKDIEDFEVLGEVEVGLCY